MNLMSVDQSLSHCAVVVWKEDKPFYRKMIRTGSTSSKGKKKKDVLYFDTPTEQIMEICSQVLELVKEFEIDTYVMESLSFGSVGNATRDLAGLFYCIQATLLEHSLSVSDLNVVAPTSVKSYARQFLPEEERTFVKERVDKKTGKVIRSVDQVKMEKSHIVSACNYAEPGWLDGLTLEAGKADYADAYFIGRVLISRKEAK